MGVGFFSANTTIKIGAVINEDGTVSGDGDSDLCYTVPAGKVGIFWGGATANARFTVDGSPVSAPTGIFIATDGAVIRCVKSGAGSADWDLHGFLIENSP